MKNAILDFGAVGDNATDNAAAFSAAAAHCNATGDLVLWPRGLYCSSSFPEITSGGFVGEGSIAGYYAHNVPEAQPYGTVFRNLSPTGDALKIGRAANGVILSGFCLWPRPYRTSGFEIVDQGKDTLIDNVSAAFVYNFLKFGAGANGSTARRVRAVAVHGPHAILIQGGSTALADWAQGIVIENYGFYTPWQVAEATCALVKGNWAAATAYSAGQIVFCAGFVLQCVVAGTSGAMAPAIPAFAFAGAITSTNIADGTAAWRLIMHQYTSGLTLDSNSACVTLDKAQINSAVTGVLLNNTLSGIAPQSVKIVNSLIDHSVRDCIQGNFGMEMTVENTDLHWSATGRGATLGSGMTGALAVRGCHVWANALNGIAFGGGNARLQLHGNRVNNNSVAAPNTYAGIWAVPNSKRLSIKDNFAGDDPWGGTAQKYGIQIDAGSDNFIVTGNECLGNGTAGLFNGAGTGPTKLVANNL